MDLIDWLEERRANCERIARTKTGDERIGWLEDEAYFKLAVTTLRYWNGETNSPIRMHIALKVLRAWNSGTAGFSGDVVYTVNKWIDDGMKGPVPWPDSPFFAEWAEKNGLSNVDGYIGYRMTVQLTEVG